MPFKTVNDIPIVIFHIPKFQCFEFGLTVVTYSLQTYIQMDWLKNFRSLAMVIGIEVTFLEQI